MSFVEYLRGEFAICIYDVKKSRLLLVRDRYGIKPFYYTVINNTLLFASEMKAFIPLGWKPEWDIDSVVHGGYFFDNRTVFKGVYKVPAAHYLTATSSGSITTHRYWDSNYPNKFKKETRSIKEMVEGVHDRLVDSVRQRLVADVPVAVFLSGGIDSSAIAGIATHLLREKDPNAKVKAFSISFTDGGIFDEGDIAERTAKYLGADFEKIPMSEDALLSDFTNHIWHLEHPFFNLSSVGRYILAKRAQAEGYKVVLTGEGSDENFGGYIYFQGDYILEPDYSKPENFESLTEEQRLSKLQQLKINSEHARYIPTIFEESKGVLARKMTKGLAAPGLLGAGLSMGEGYYRTEVIDQCGSPDAALAFAENSIDGLARYKIRNEWHPLHSSMYLEINTLLVNVLTASPGERCDMAFSVESRVPFLDHPLTEYVMGLPPSLKIKGDPKTNKFNEKWVLKEAVKPYVTEELYKRTKEPFIAPMARGHNDLFVSMVNSHLTKENIDKLGWADYDKIHRATEKYINEGSKDNRVYQDILFLISFVIISQRFNVSPYKFSNKY